MCRDLGLDLCRMRERPVPARLQFARHQSIGWIGSIILPEGAIGSVASRFEVAAEGLPHLISPDRDIVLLALLLHDIGWWSIDMHDIIENGFGPNMMQSDVRFLHEKEGVRLSREVLQKTGWPESVIKAVAEIIDGHDTRPRARSLNDRLVRDADKLWRFTVTGVAVACDWFKLTPHAYADRLEKQVATLETEAGR